MTCFHPIKAYRSREKDPSTGRYQVTFNSSKSLVEGSSFSVPCGQCIGCRVSRSRQWATRCLHEAKTTGFNSFVTLTFDEGHYPASGSVALRDIQLFMKRLRKFLTPYAKLRRLGHHAHVRAFWRYQTTRVRFFACGEYSPQNLHPHYHLLIFGFDFPDKYKWKTENKNILYRSALLEKLWTQGFSTIGAVNFTTANYVAQYILKKMTGDRAADHYTWPHYYSGVLVRVQPEFITMSTKPGLGSAWFELFKGDCYPSDFLIVDGRKMPIPQYYDQKLKAEAEAELEKLKRRRKKTSLARRADGTPARLAVREQKLALDVDRKKRVLQEWET